MVNCCNCKHYSQPSLAPPHRCVDCMRRDEPFALWEPKPITNANRFRAMSDEELAEWFANKDTCPPGACTHMYDGVDCDECWLDWLRRGVSDAG